MTDTVDIINGDTVSKDNFRRALQAVGWMRDYIQSGFRVSDGSGLNASVSSGVAVMSGVRVQRSVSTTLALSDNTTNHIWVGYDESAANTVAFTVNTTGTAPSGVSIKLATVVTSGGAITAINPLNGESAPGRNQSLFARFATAGGFAGLVFERDVRFNQGDAGVPDGLWTKYGTTTTSVGQGFAQLHIPLNTAGSSANATAFDAGDVVELCAVLKFSARAGLGANQLIFFGLADIGTSADNDDTAGTTNHRIIVGLTSSGNYKIVTCDGAAVTTTDTGVAHTDAEKVHLSIVFTKGTNVVVTITTENGKSATSTVTANLPTKLLGVVSGCGGGTATSKFCYVLLAALRITKA